MFRRNYAQFRIPIGRFRFQEEPIDNPSKKSEPNKAEPSGGEPQNSPAPTPEPKSAEELISELQQSSPKVYNTIFGRGVKKGESSKKPVLDDEHLKAAKKLFAQVNPEDIDKLLKAKKSAEAAAIAQAKTQQDFSDYSERITAQHKEEIEREAKVFNAQIASLKEQVLSLEETNGKLVGTLKDIKITKELLSAGQSGGLIDPSDAVAQLAGRLSLNDDLDIVDVKTDRVASIAELVSQLVKAKPHLVASGQRTGQGSAPPGTPSVSSTKKTIYTRSQLRDSDFFKANEKDIMLAAQEGRIKDDIGK